MMVWSEVKNQQSEDDALTDMKIGLPYIVVATSMILIIIMCIVRQKKQSSDQRYNHVHLWDESNEVMSPQMFGNSVENPTKSDTVEVDVAVDKDANCNGTTVMTQAISFKENSTNLLKTSVEVTSCDVTIETCLFKNNNVQYDDYEVIDYPSTNAQVNKSTTVISNELKDTNKAHRDIVSSDDVNAPCQPDVGSISSRHVCESILQDSVKPFISSTADTDDKAQSDLTNSPSSPNNLPYFPTNSSSTSPNSHSSPTNSSSSSTNSHSFPINSSPSPTHSLHTPVDLPSSPADSLFSPVLRSIDLVAIYIPDDDDDDDDDDSSMPTVANPLLAGTAPDQNAQNTQDVTEVEMNDNKQSECHMARIQELETAHIHGCKEMQSCKEIVEVHSLSDDMSSPTKIFDRTDAIPTSDLSPVVSNSADILELPLKQEIPPQKSYLVSVNIPREDSSSTDIIPTEEQSTVVSNSGNTLELPVRQEITPKESYLVNVNIPREDSGSTDIIPTVEQSSVVSDSNDAPKLPVKRKLATQEPYSVIDIPHKDGGDIEQPSSVSSDSDNTLELPVKQETASKESYLVSINILHENHGTQTAEPSSVVNDSDDIPKLPVRQKLQEYSVTIDIPCKSSGAMPSLVKNVQATCDSSCDEIIILQKNPAYVTISDMCTAGIIDDTIELQRNPAYFPIEHASSGVHLYEEISYPITAITSDTTIKMEKNPAYHWTTIKPAESLS